MTAAYGSIDPNSQHQVWSRWVFGVEAAPNKLPPVSECVDNARRFFSKGFASSVGRVRCDQQGTYYVFVAEIEGPPAHDPAYAESVRKEFAERFMVPGFGPGAQLVRFTTGILAGNQQDGNPPDQLLVLPSIPLFEE